MSLFCTVTLNEVLPWGEKSALSEEARVGNWSSR